MILSQKTATTTTSNSSLPEPSKLSLDLWDPALGCGLLHIAARLHRTSVGKRDGTMKTLGTFEGRKERCQQLEKTKAQECRLGNFG